MGGHRDGPRGSIGPRSHQMADGLPINRLKQGVPRSMRREKVLAVAVVTEPMFRKEMQQELFEEAAYVTLRPDALRRDAR